MSNFLLIPDGEYEFVQFDDDAHWVVRDENGDVYSEEQHSPRHKVEVLIGGDWVDASTVEGLEALGVL